MEVAQTQAILRGKTPLVLPVLMALSGTLHMAVGEALAERHQRRVVLLEGMGVAGVAVVLLQPMVAQAAVV